MWRAALSHNPASTEGCFEAEYPSLIWVSVECAVGEPRARPAPRTTEGGTSDVTGNGHDCALGATGTITFAQGSPRRNNINPEERGR